MLQTRRDGDIYDIVASGGVPSEAFHQQLPAT